jgi:hypothetical protein
MSPAVAAAYLLCAAFSGSLVSILAAPAPDASTAPSLAPAAAPAAPEPVVMLARTQLSGFNDALEAVAAQAHVAIVAEGIPLHPVLAEKDVLSLAGQDRPLTELMRVLAAAYDYNLRRSGTVFLLVKRYSDPADLPSVTMGEWTRCLRQLARLTDAFNPHIDFGYHPGDSLRNHIVGDLAASFTAAQLAGLRGDGLRLRVLNPAQVALVRRFALYLYVQQRADQLRRLLAILDAAENTAVFHYADVGTEKHVLGYDISFGRPARPPLFTPITSEAETPSHQGDPSGMVAVPLADTIGDVVDGLNARAVGALKVHCEPSLRTKTITVAGATNASPRELLSAIADVYGLIAVAPSAGGAADIDLEFRAPPSFPERAAGLQSAFEIVIPAPLLRALHSREAVDALKAAQQLSYRTYRRGPPPAGSSAETGARDPTTDESAPELERAIQDRKLSLDGDRVLKQFDGSSTRLGLLPREERAAAMKRLRALVEPQVAASQSGRLEFSSLGGKARDAYASVVGSDCMLWIGQWMCWAVPEYIEDFDHAILIGGLNSQSGGKQPTLSLFFGATRPDGRVDRGDGMAGAQYVK